MSERETQIIYGSHFSWQMLLENSLEEIGDKWSKLAGERMKADLVNGQVVVKKDEKPMVQEMQKENKKREK